LIPFFKCNAVLAIPNIVIQPGLDEVQNAVTKAAHSIVNVSSGVAQWSKDRKAHAAAAAEKKRAEKAAVGKSFFRGHERIYHTYIYCNWLFIQLKRKCQL